MLNVILKSAAFAGALTAVVLYILISQSRVELQRELDEARNAARTAEIERDRALADRAAFEHDINDLNSNLKMEKSKSVSLKRQNIQAHREISEFSRKLESAEQNEQKWEIETQNVRRRLLSTNTDFQKEFLESLADYEAMISSLGEKVAHLQREFANQQSNTMGSYGYTANPTAGSSKTFEGTILDIGPENSIIALDLGIEQGARQGMKLTLWKNTEFQAQVTLSVVRPEFSIGYIISNSRQFNKLKKGQKVTIILP